MHWQSTQNRLVVQQETLVDVLASPALNLLQTSTHQVCTFPRNNERGGGGGGESHQRIKHGLNRQLFFKLKRKLIKTV
jgi:hypothetical protein